MIAIRVIVSVDMNPPNVHQLGSICWLRARRRAVIIECAPVVIIGSVHNLEQYTVKRLDVDCVMARIYGFELQPMQGLEQLAWVEALESH